MNEQSNWYAKTDQQRRKETVGCLFMVGVIVVVLFVVAVIVVSILGVG